jgi:hypothetical protein
VENILDKLVEAPIAPVTRDEGAATEEVVSDAASEAKPDEHLLSALIGSSQTDRPDPVVPEQKVETETVEAPAPEQEQVRKNILDRLTGGSTDQSGQDEATGNSQAGGSGDA